MVGKHEIPPPSDADYLDRLERYVGVARSYKELVESLSIEDLSDEDYFSDLSNQEGLNFDEEGRLKDSFQLAHGHYTVPHESQTLSDEITEINTVVYLSKIDGGRKYELWVSTILHLTLSVSYFEDMPIVPGFVCETEDILKRFRVEKEMASSIGAHPSDMTIIETLIGIIHNLISANRLTNDGDCTCD